MAWTKGQRDRAKAESKGLFEYRYKGKRGGMELAGVMDDETAANLFGFVMAVYRGTPPAQALFDAGLAVDALSPVADAGPAGLPAAAGCDRAGGG
jgi:hypothetical protein